MRVIEPKPTRRQKKNDVHAEVLPAAQPLRKPLVRRQLIKVMAAAAVIGLALIVAIQAFGPGIDTNSKPAASKKSADDTSAPLPKTNIKVFSADAFRQLYDSVSYPNTQPIIDPPVISGNETADTRMRAIAVGRGYKLRSIPVAPIIKIGDPNLGDDDLLQQKALDGWHELQAAAKKDGIPLRILSGYRSVDFQRNLFLARLDATATSIEQVAAGIADAQVNQVLNTSALPGYSRHHTGYTVDLQCDDGALEAFVNSRCFPWISKNNYLNAKTWGWIPSYPAGASRQGPEPEPWEYVWVGKDAVRE